MSPYFANISRRPPPLNVAEVSRNSRGGMWVVDLAEA